MVRRLTARLGDARRAFATNLRSADLRRAQGAFAGAWAAEGAFTVGLGVVAFRDGGATAVGLVALLRMLPAAAVVPFAAALADRAPREQVLIWGSLARALATALAAAVLYMEGPLVAVYALAVVSTVVVAPFRGAHSALLPSLCRTTEELASSNVVRGMLDSLSMLLGPAAAGVLIGLGSVEAVFVAAAASALAAAWLLSRLEYEPPPRQGPLPPLRIRADTLEVVRAVRRDGDVALVLALAAQQTFTRGCLTVFTVVVAIDLLEMGEAGVGVLTAAVGAGAVAGSIGASLLVGTRRLLRWFGIGVALWSLPLAMIALVPSQAPALAMLSMIGIANAIVDVGLFTGQARLVPDDMLARVFGLQESFASVAGGLGSILTPVLIAAFGLHGALAAVGAFGPLCVLLGWRRLRRIDHQMLVRGLEVRLLQGVPMLRPLPMATIEHLARHAQRVSFRAGDVVFREGDAGDGFYVISEGQVELQRAGDTQVVVGRGDAFGEVALLREVPRMMTAVARGDVAAYQLSAAAFVTAVSGYSAAASVAEDLLATRVPAPATS